MKTFSAGSMLALAIFLLFATPAHADSISLVLDNTVEFGNPGKTLSFDAIASAPATNGAAVDLASDTFNLDSPLTLDDSGFFNGFPASLAPGSFYSGLLFTVNIPTATAFGIYHGSFSIEGDSGNILSTVNFNVDVVPTPEPGSLVLLATGVLGVAGAGYRRWGRGQPDAGLLRKR